MTVPPRRLTPLRATSSTTIKFLQADVRQLIGNLWPLVAFHVARVEVQRAVARHVKDGMAPVLAGFLAGQPVAWRDRVPDGVVWTPDRQYLNTGEVAVLALAVALPDRATPSLVGRAPDGSLIRWLADPSLLPLAGQIAPIARQLAVLAGYDPPSFLPLFVTAYALIAPASTPAKLVEVIPLLLPMVYHHRDATVSVDPLVSDDVDFVPPASVRRDVSAWHDAMASGRVKRPHVDVASSGRHARFVDRTAFLAELDGALRGRLNVGDRPDEMTLTDVAKALAVDRKTLREALDRFSIDYKKRARQIAKSMGKNGEKSRGGRQDRG